MTKYLTLILLLTFTSTVSAQTDNKVKSEMNVDLPDETEETDLIEKGQLQLETQYLCAKYQAGSSSAIWQALLRYGVSKRLEVRLLVEDGKERDLYMEQTVQSTYPLAGSIKFSVLKDHKWLPDITLVTYLKLPFTSREEEQKIYWSPIFLAAFQHKIGDKWKLEYNGGIQQEAYGKEWAWLVNASLHYKLVQDLEIFLEYYAQYQKEEDPHHNAGLGLAYQLGEHVEFYAVAGSSVFYQEGNKFISGGVAVRMP